VSGLAVSEQSIAARLERLPVSPWHVKMRVILGVATFFDAFDALSIAYVLPVLIGAWKIAPQQIGWLISIGFAGQAVGALFFGWLAERIGRVPVARITIAIFAIMSLVCATADSYEQLFWYRFVQGIGLGGEVPVAAAYISEIARADRRGGFFLLYELIFPIGLLAAAAIGSQVVPLWGWQWMFIIGAVPAVLILFMQRICPESPRWLASQGRLEEADKNLTRIEDTVSRHGASPLPPVPQLAARPAGAPTRIAELFEGRYRARTFAVWLLWASSYLVGYGIQAWLPSMYRTVYHLSIQDSLNYSVATSACGLLGAFACAMVIDRLGRRKWFIGAFFLCCAGLFWLAFTGASEATQVLVFASFSYIWIASLNLAVYLYTAEIYPTRMRALGTSLATFWLRVASVAGPFIVGYILPIHGIAGVFFLFACVAGLGGIVSILGVIETRGRVLEEVSP
jgi:putative MFS transporter